MRKSHFIAANVTHYPAIKPIIFEPKYEVGQTVFFMVNNNMEWGTINARNFYDQGPEEYDMEVDGDMVLLDKEPAIIADPLRIILITYELRITKHDIEDMTLAEEFLFDTPDKCLAHHTKAMKERAKTLRDRVKHRL